MGLFRKSKPAAISYDPKRQEPVIRKSICTGEMTAGLVDLDTGTFHDLMRLDGEEAVRQFCSSLGVDHVRVIY
ncbi:MAG: aspartate dehydrogenase [Clostridia bacterium]|nr:aspartate dehydrogenase [Clostridia bacterium]